MSAQKRALKWLKTHGRKIDLDYANWNISGNSGSLLESLTAYQNSDGGFGNQLEPDVRLGDSSVLATTIALQLLSECQVGTDNDLIMGAAKYLKNVYNRKNFAWQIVPQNVDDAAHAPWWAYKDISNYMINPRAEIVGYMFEWEEHFDTTIRNQILNQIWSDTLSATELEMHDILVIDRMIRASHFPINNYLSEIDHFNTLALAAITKSPEEWDSYGFKPLTLIRSPEHPLYHVLKEDVNRNIEYMLEHQNSDGSWKAPWNWFGSYEKDWPDAEQDIISKTTADNHNILRNFGIS